MEGINSHNGERSEREYKPDLTKTEKDFKIENLLCHTKKGFDKTVLPATPEAALMRICDKISYIPYDMVDGIREGFISGLNEEYRIVLRQLGITDKVKFVGWLDKTHNNYYYSIAKYWVSIPKSDATSISLFEAMSFDCIPVVSDLPANREWVKDGENGLVVSDINSNFIALATDIPTEKVVRINRDIVMKNATKEANKAKYLGIYKKILEPQ